MNGAIVDLGSNQLADEVPESMLSVISTRWGLFRHCWILVKLLINIAATIVLLIYMQTLGYLADLAAETTTAQGDSSGLRSPSAVIHAGAAILLLVMATVLSVYKPRGMTRYG